MLGSFDKWSAFLPQVCHLQDDRIKFLGWNVQKMTVPLLLSATK